VKELNITLGKKHPSTGRGNLIFSFIPTQQLNTSTTQHHYNKYFHLILETTQDLSLRRKMKKIEMI